MSKYPTITLGGFITSEEVTELAALLAKNDYYPAIMAGEGLLDRECDDLEHEARGRFYLDAINQSIQEGQPFRFGTLRNDPETEFLPAEQVIGYTHDPLWRWLDKRLHRLVRRSYTPGGTVSINGNPTLSIFLDDVGEGPLLNLSSVLHRAESGKELRPDTATEILRRALHAIRVFNFNPPPLIIPAVGSHIAANLESSSFNLVRALKNLADCGIDSVFDGAKEEDTVSARARKSAEAFRLLQYANNPLRLTLGGTE
jgi:hypothetical protein